MRIIYNHSGYYGECSGKNTNRKYTVHKIGHNRTYAGTKCTIKEEHYYQYIQLRGNSKAIRKINKALKQEKESIN